MAIAGDEPPWTAAASREVVEASPSGTAFLDEEGVILYVNTAWERFANENGGDPELTGIGCNYLEACGPSEDAGSMAQRVVEQVLSRRQPSATTEYPCHSPTERRWYRLRCYQVDQPPVAAVVVHDDLTDHYLANEARARLKDEVAKAEQLAAQQEHGQRMMNAIGHALRSPLTPVRLQLATLAHQAGKEVPKNVVDSMRSSIEQLVAAVQDTLQAIDLDQDHFKPTPQSADDTGAALQGALTGAGLRDVALNLEGTHGAALDVDLVVGALAAVIRAQRAIGADGPGVVHAHFGGTTRLELALEPGQNEDTSDAMALPIALCEHVAKLHSGRFDARQPGLFRLEFSSP